MNTHRLPTRFADTVCRPRSNQGKVTRVTRCGRERGKFVTFGDAFRLSAGAAALLLTTAAASAQAPAGAALKRFFIGSTEGVGTEQVLASGKHAVRDRHR